MPTNIVTVWQRSICAAAGALAGAVAGLLFELSRTGGLSTTEAVQAGLVLGIVGWLAVLVVIGLWLHLGLSAIAARSFFTSMITAVLTILVDNRIAMPVFDVWVGLLIGTIVGLILCRLCQNYLAAPGGNQNAMR